jgi:hypothetical protein
MRPRTKPPVNRRYFHTKRKIEKKDVAVLKKKIQVLHDKKIKKEFEDKKKKKYWDEY